MFLLDSQPLLWASSCQKFHFGCPFFTHLFKYLFLFRSWWSTPRLVFVLLGSDWWIQCSHFKACVSCSQLLTSLFYQQVVLFLVCLLYLWKYHMSCVVMFINLVTCGFLICILNVGFLWWVPCMDYLVASPWGAPTPLPSLFPFHVRKLSFRTLVSLLKTKRLLSWA